LRVASVENRIKTKWRRTQVVRERSAKPLCSGSNPLGASINCGMRIVNYGFF
jgi:hypothetical protein